MHVTNLNIVQITLKCEIIKRENHNLPKTEDPKQPNCTKEKKDSVREVFGHFRIMK